MIAQIASQSGVPPSRIAATWSVDELQDAVTLARLEDRGRDVTRFAELKAEIHNAVRWAVWQYAEDDKEPTWLKGRQFLPKVVKPKKPLGNATGRKQKENQSQTLMEKQLAAQADFMNRMAGF